MQILKPIVHETIWGGSKLTKYSGGDCHKIGHLYAFIDNASMKSEIIYGADAGKNLHDWFLANRKRFGLDSYRELPILGALVEAADTLSIQVHPDDDKASLIDGLPFGKNESFYTLEAPTCGKMYNGCNAKSPEDMLAKMKAGEIASVLDMMPCEAGDYVYIEGGTLHAATAGSLHFEIEENCDRTYRFYDFDRVDKNGAKRPLQLETALTCLDVTKKSKSRKYGAEPIEERMYSTQLIRDQMTFNNLGGMFAFAVMIRGEKVIHNIRILPGTTILLEPGEQLDVSGAEFIICKPKAPVFTSLTDRQDTQDSGLVALAQSSGPRR